VCAHDHIFLENPLIAGPCIPNPANVMSNTNDNTTSKNVDGYIGIRCAGIFIRGCETCKDIAAGKG
jgi:hypothetical protein